MATTFDLNTAGGPFDEGDVVGAYLVSVVGEHPSGDPVVSPTTTATVTSGIAAFTGLTDGLSYYAAASVDGTWHFVKFTVGQDAPGSGFYARVDRPETFTDNLSVAGNLAVSGKLGVNGSTPVGKASAYTQTYSTTARTVPAATAVAVATTAATNSSPYGFAQAQADAIVAAANANMADILALKKLIGALIDDLQAVGIVG